MGEPNVRESRRIDWGGTLPVADVAFAESTDSVELAGAAEKAAAAKPEALVLRMRGKLQADVRGRCKNVDWWRVQAQGVAARGRPHYREETQQRRGLATLKSIAPGPWREIALKH